MPEPNQVEGEGLIADNNSLSALGVRVGGDDLRHVGPRFPFYCNYQTK